MYECSSPWAERGPAWVSLQGVNMGSIIKPRSLFNRYHISVCPQGHGLGWTKATDRVRGEGELVIKERLRKLSAFVIIIIVIIINHY